MLFNDEDFNWISWLNIPDNDSQCQLTTAWNGFLKGNMFPAEYIPYRNYKPVILKATNSQTEKLFKIMALAFALNDLNLKLDLNPNDGSSLKLFNKLNEEKHNLEKEYVATYGPLLLSQVKGSKFDWLNPFPWEKTGGDQYV